MSSAHGGREIDLTRRPDDPLSLRGKLFYLRDLDSRRPPATRAAGRSRRSRCGAWAPDSPSRSPARRGCASSNSFGGVRARGRDRDRRDGSRRDLADPAREPRGAAAPDRDHELPGAGARRGGRLPASSAALGSLRGHPLRGAALRHPGARSPDARCAPARRAAGRSRFMRCAPVATAPCVSPATRTRDRASSAAARCASRARSRRAAPARRATRGCSTRSIRARACASRSLSRRAAAPRSTSSTAGSKTSARRRR